MKKLTQLCAALAYLLGARFGLESFASRLYVGSTAGSSASNPPVLLWRGAGARTILGTSQTSAWSSASPRAGGIQQWQYISTNLTTDLTGAGFFTDGKQLGMQIGDIIHCVQYTSAGSSFIYSAGVLTSTNSSAGFNLNTLGLVSSTRASSL